MAYRSNTEGHVYVLELENNYWYVGHTIHIRERIKQHFQFEKRTLWTELHKPIAIHMAMPATIFLENQVTLDMMWIYGHENVRGGTYAKPDLPKSFDPSKLEPPKIVLGPFFKTPKSAETILSGVVGKNFIL